MYRRRILPGVRGILAGVLFFAFAALAANVKLYLKDGGHHVVREYAVQGDRVRFYSVERSGWEEIPLALVDLDRTKKEQGARRAALEEEARILSEEDKAERALQDEISKIPQNAGVYYLAGGQAKAIRQAESKVRTRKGRSILKAVTPIPIVPGKGTVEIELDHSLNVFDNPLPEFYIQLSSEQRFGIIKLVPKKGLRIVEEVTFIPVSNEVVEQPVEVEIFRKQLTPDGLYKIWPVNALEPGEYAVVEYTAGKLNIQVWDFRIVAEKKS